MRERAAAFLRLHPLLGGAFAAVTAVVAMQVSLGLFLIAVVAVSAFAQRLLGKRAAGIAFCCALAAGGSCPSVHRAEPSGGKQERRIRAHDLG